jgi:small acid-soluble spore protein H (minor)
MDINRAKEISQSGELANVRYQGKAIYIQSINEDLKTARIYPLNNPASEIEVPIENLREQ